MNFLLLQIRFLVNKLKLKYTYKNNDASYLLQPEMSDNRSYMCFEMHLEMLHY